MLYIEGIETQLSIGDEVHVSFKENEMTGLKIMRGEQQLIETRKDTVWHAVDSIVGVIRALEALCEHYNFSFAEKKTGRPNTFVWVFRPKY